MFQLFEFYLEPLEKYKFDVKNPAIESKTKLELLKNSLVPINKTALIARFHKIETDGELIFQQFYWIFSIINQIDTLYPYT
ncbi:hypothetical protein LIAUS_18030 [Leptospira interrogans]